MRTIQAVIVSAVVVHAVACSSSSDESDDPDNGSTSAALDCSWIASNNCWKQALDEVAVCMSDGSASGTLAADERSCSYDNGTIVRFDQPLLPWPADPIGLTMEVSGEQCVRFDRDFGLVRVETAGGIVTAQAELGSCQNCFSMVISCPDGSTYRTDDYLATMQACEPDPSDWPGSVVEQMAPGRVGLDLAGGNDGQTTLFACTY